jgi:hypothetical protein
MNKEYMSKIIDKKQDLLLDSISSFYLSKKEHIDKLIDILNGRYASLRIIDWFATNYSKKHNIGYTLTREEPKSFPNKFELFKVYINYKSQLKSYSKKQFDPFNRTQRIKFYYESDKFITTTICQLNFFRWAIENNVIDYIKEHITEIEKDMNESVNYVYNKKKDGEKVERKKRKELSVSATKFLNKNDITILVKFD